MEIDISYISLKHYKGIDKRPWLYRFVKYTYIKGFVLRILGVELQIKESNATQKLIDLFREKHKIK